MGYDEVTPAVADTGDPVPEADRVEQLTPLARDERDELDPVPNTGQPVADEADWQEQNMSVPDGEEDYTPGPRE